VGVKNIWSKVPKGTSLHHSVSVDALICYWSTFHELNIAK